jgi:predicted amidohydrolase YtcJ
MFCHSTNTASFFSVLIAALIFSLSLAGAAAAPSNTSLRTGALQNNARGSYTRAADLIVIGDIYTMDASAPKAEAIAVAGGRLVFVGNARRARALLRRGGRTIKLAPGQSVLPGFVDSHVHMIEGGLQLNDCPIQPPEPKSKPELAKKITDCADKHPEKTWLIGNGWPAALFGELGPSKEELDALVPDRPAVIYEDSGHSAWLNSAALLAAGIGPDTEDPPPNGRIERQPDSPSCPKPCREPSGTLREQAAMDLVEKPIPPRTGIPPRTDEEYAAALAVGQRELHKVGITLVQDAEVEPPFLKAYHAAAMSGVLTMKVVAAQLTDPRRDLASQVDELIALRESLSAGRLTASSAKIFLDGQIEGRTAALLEPYEGRDDSGTPNWSASALTKIARLLDAAGFQIHMHGIGDRAIREALDALAAVRAKNGPSDLRHHIAHLQLVDPADIPRFAELGVSANFQPFWMFRDSSFEAVEPLIGPERAERLYEIRSFEQAGTRIVAGSDWPVSDPKPLLAIQVGMTRRDPMDAGAPVWNPAQRVSLDTLLRAYTIEGATLNHRERDTGSLEVGKAADFIILDRDLFAIPPEDIGKTQVLATFVDGVQVHP